MRAPALGGDASGVDGAPVRILDAYPARALNDPGSPAEVVVELSSQAPAVVEVQVALLDLGQVVSTSRRTIEVGPGTTVATLAVAVPPEDPRGYAVRVVARWPADGASSPNCGASSPADGASSLARTASASASSASSPAGWTPSSAGQATATTALLAASHWRLLPRYGFLSDFAPAAGGAADDPVGLLARFHVTAVQFYDWMYRHYRFLPPEDAVAGEDEVFVDAMDREVSLRTVRRRVRECHERGMAAIAYGAVYGPEPEFILERPDWLLYDAAGAPMHLIDRFYITDLRPGGWREHILGEFESAVAEVGFDGIHMDQYGFPKLAYDSAGVSVDVSAEFGGLIDEAAARVAAAREGAAVIFNTVNDWPLDRVARSDQAAIYIEVWSPHDTYRDLVMLVRRARELSGRQAILAAYLRPFHEPGEAAEWSLRYATAVINAAGGHHLILGEGDAVLREPYYPDHGRLSEQGRAATRRYYDHTAAYAHYLHAQDLRPVERYYATGVNTALNLSGAPASVFPEAGKVWLAIARRSGQIVVNLVNLTALEDDLWDAPRPAPRRLSGLGLECEPFLRPDRVTWTSPDDAGSLGSTLEAQVAPDGRVTIELPDLELWQTVVIEHS